MMTIDQVLALPEISPPQFAVWREDDDPVWIWDLDGRCWSVARIKGQCFRFRVPREDVA
jgi:hypothetical protein